MPQAGSVLAFPASQQMPEKHQASESTAHPGADIGIYTVLLRCAFGGYGCVLGRDPEELGALGHIVRLPPFPESPRAAPWGGGEQRGHLEGKFPGISSASEASIFRLLPCNSSTQEAFEIAAVPPSTLELWTFRLPESGGTWKTKSTVSHFRMERGTSLEML